MLKGEGYASPVKFWMPFNGGIGFHDASWRNTFGGTIYKKNGSHGCVNMPYEAAKTLYENVYKGMPVICYNLEGTERSTAGSASGRAEPPASASPTAVPETVPQTVPQTPPRQSLLFRLLLCSPQKQCPRRRRKRSRQSRLRKYTDRAVRKALKIRKLALPDRE